jgi:hypothetical protein
LRISENIDHTTHRIGTIGSRIPTVEDLHALDFGGREQTEIQESVLKGADSTPVEKDKGVLGSKASLGNGLEAGRGPIILYEYTRDRRYSA